KGSFTGAALDRTGLMETADGGTLFLDEIANASLIFQTRLLRVLQEREIRRVGENHTRSVDFRVVAATSGRLSELMAAGRFREDLYYRLNVISIHVPSLRQRGEDIIPLADHFLVRSCTRHALPPRRFTRAATEILLRYSWPGNVRELENVVERSVLMAPGASIDASLLPAGLLDSLLDLERGAGTQDCKTGEQRLIEKTLLQTGGDKSRAARLIGWHRTKLYRRLRRYGIPYDLGRERGTSSENVRPSVSRGRSL
ncbi:MAG: sigma 54-interacting transcriptional regulator, partial [Acidobacteriota bacterium]